MHASLKLEVIDGRAQQGVEHAAYFDSTRGNLLVHIEIGRACLFFVDELSCQKISRLLQSLKVNAIWKASTTE